MRCIICNRVLSDREAVKRDKYTGEFLDTCSVCLASSALNNNWCCSSEDDTIEEQLDELLHELEIKSSAEK